MDKAMGEKDSLNKSEAQIYAEEQNAKNKALAQEAAKNAGSSDEAMDQLLAQADDKANGEGGWSSQEILDSFDQLVAEREGSVSGSTKNVDENLGGQGIQGTEDPFLNQINAVLKNLSAQNAGQNICLNW